MAEAHPVKNYGNNYGAGNIPGDRDTSGATRACLTLLILSLGAASFSVMRDSPEDFSRDWLGLQLDRWNFALVMWTAILFSVRLSEVLYRATYFVDELSYPHFQDHYNSNYADCASMVLGCLWQHGCHTLVTCIPVLIAFIRSHGMGVDVCALLLAQLKCLFYLPFIMLPYFIVAVHIQRISLAELRHVEHRKAQYIGYGLAYAYYFGYLRLLLPEFEENINLSKAKTMRAKRLMILVPEDGNTSVPGSFTFVCNTPDIVKARAGHKARTYSFIVHKVKNDVCALTFPPPVNNIYDAGLTDAGMTGTERVAEVKLFYKTLTNILRTNARECYKTEERVWDEFNRKYFTVTTPMFQIITYKNNECSDVQLQNRITRAINDCENYDLKPPADRVRDFDEEVRRSLGKPERHVINQIPGLSSLTTRGTQRGVMVALGAWVLLLCAAHHVTAGAAILVLALATATVAATHAGLWRALVFLVDYFNKNFTSCYSSAAQFWSDCALDIEFPYRCPERMRRAPSLVPVGAAAVLAMTLYCDATASYLLPSARTAAQVAYFTTSAPLMLTVAVLIQHLFSSLVSDVELVRAAHNNVINLYKGLAVGYLSFLRTVLPALKHSMAGDSEVAHESVPRRLISLVATDASCPKKLGGRVRWRKDMELRMTGSLDRKFSLPVYDVLYTQPAQACVAEYPAILLNLFDMWRCGLVSRSALPYHVKLFYAECLALLHGRQGGSCQRNPRLYAGQCCLITLVLYQPDRPSADCTADFDYETMCNHCRDITGDNECQECIENSNLVSQILSETIARANNDNVE